MNNITIQSVQNTMQSAINSNGGLDVVLAHYDSVYRECFKMAPVKICDLLNVYCKTQEQYYSEFNTLTRMLRCEVVSSLFKANNSNHEQDYDGYMMDAWEDSNKTLINTLCDFTEETLICETCNYKGEVEGYQLAQLCNNMREFKGKANSFNF